MHTRHLCYHSLNSVQKRGIMLLKKIKNTPIMALCILLFAGLLVCNNTGIAQAKTKKCHFKKTITTLSVNKNFHYRIVGCTRKAKITFHSNHPKIASINKKSGILKAKKKGRVTITAKIKQSKKKTVLLKTKLRITGKSTKTTSSKSTSSSLNKKSSQTTTSANTTTNSTILDDVSWTADTSINPWNHSLILYSNRILLKKEVQNSTLILSHSGQNMGQAHYRSLSSDGKKITYQLTSETAKKLCPGNGTANGSYHISSPILNSTLTTNYEERLTPGTLCGFVSDTSHNALSNVVVSLYKSNTSSHHYAQTKTDAFGAYSFKKIPKGSYYMTYSHPNYNMKNIPAFDMPDSTYCINTVLQQSTHSVSISLINEDNIPMSNCTVIITNTRTNKSWNGKTNTDGLFMLSNAAIENITSCSLINNADEKISYKSNSPFAPKIDPATQLIDNDFSADDSYCITVYASDSENSTATYANYSTCYQPMSFSFTPNAFRQEHILFALAPKKIPATRFSSLSVENNTATNNDTITSDFRLTLYTKSGKTLMQSSITVNVSSSYEDLTAEINRYLQQYKLYLPDDNYYLSLISTNATSNFACSPSLQKITVQNGIISPIKFSLQSGIPTRLLVYGHFSNAPSSDTPIILYQKMDSVWFSIYDFTSKEWTNVSDDIYKIYLDHCLYEDNATYQIASSNPSPENSDSIFTVYAKESTNILARSLTGTNTKFYNSMYSSAAPNIKYYDLTHSSAAPNIKLYDSTHFSAAPDFKLYYHSNTSSDIIADESITSIPITDELLSSDPDEKNCVIACFSSSGTMCSISWTSKNEKPVYDRTNNFIFDRICTHCPVTTTQGSYQ